MLGGYCEKLLLLDKASNNISNIFVFVARLVSVADEKTESNNTSKISCDIIKTSFQQNIFLFDFKSQNITKISFDFFSFVI